MRAFFAATAVHLPPHHQCDLYGGAHFPQQLAATSAPGLRLLSGARAHQCTFDALPSDTLGKADNNNAVGILAADLDRRGRQLRQTCRHLQLHRYRLRVACEGWCVAAHFHRPRPFTPLQREMPQELAACRELL
ncbi:hypothetical protein NDU88_004391 [Pleurodeles waltl]|uniref:Uncharacterized protein n=1 Tax=Pleurodeles waltl TaxID=8319 RepID=A0AAV7V106_PLEWA|nr:hypothetical protein NDU88_004391 [Pleurodeles waltl]